MRRYALPFCLAASLSLCIAVSPLRAGEKPVEALLPAMCGSGWAMEGAVATYAKDNLYKYIDGEAELYLPYGFEKAATVMYVQLGSKEGGLVVNLFKMGSLLDAFGIYANYRTPSLDRAPVGTAGFVDESQIMFFQDRYFVQVMTSGTVTEVAPLLLACAASVGRNLPDSKVEPRELVLLRVPGLIPGTEKYFPEGLLGYGFLGRGLTAEVMLKGDRVKVFVVMGGSKEGIAKTLDGYAKYLSDSRAVFQVSRGEHGSRLEAVDPLFKGVVLQQSGPYAIGLTGLKALHDGDASVAEWLGRLPKE